MRRVFRLLVLALIPSASFGQLNPPTRLYDNVTQNTYLLSQCGELTPARQEWLSHLMGHAKKRTDWTDSEWAAHGALIVADLQRRYPRPPPQDQCRELARLIDAERRNTIRD